MLGAICYILLFQLAAMNFIDSGGTVLCSGINSCIGTGLDKTIAVGSISCTGLNSCQSIEMYTDAEIHCTADDTCINVPRFQSLELNCLGKNSCTMDISQGVQATVLTDTTTLKTSVATLQTEVASLPSLTGFSTLYNSPVVWKDISNLMVTTRRNTGFWETIPLDLYNVDWTKNVLARVKVEFQGDYDFMIGVVTDGFDGWLTTPVSSDAANRAGWVFHFYKASNVYYLRYDLKSTGEAAVFNCASSCADIQEDSASVGRSGTDLQITSGDVLTLEIYPGEGRISLSKDQSDSANKLVEYIGCVFENLTPLKVVATLNDLNSKRTSITALSIEQPTVYFDIAGNTLTKYTTMQVGKMLAFRNVATDHYYETIPVKGNAIYTTNTRAKFMVEIFDATDSKYDIMFGVVTKDYTSWAENNHICKSDQDASCPLVEAGWAGKFTLTDSDNTLSTLSLLHKASGTAGFTCSTCGIVGVVATGAEVNLVDYSIVTVEVSISSNKISWYVGEDKRAELTSVTFDALSPFKFAVTLKNSVDRRATVTLWRVEAF